MSFRGLLLRATARGDTVCAAESLSISLAPLSLLTGTPRVTALSLARARFVRNAQRRPLTEIVRGCYAQRLATIIHQCERDFRMSQRIVCNQIGQVVTLSGFGTQKLATRRCVEKQIAYRDRCPTGMGGVLHVTQAATFDDHAGPGARIFCEGH